VILCLLDPILFRPIEHEPKMRGEDDRAPMTVWTIGHSTRSLEAFVAALEGNGIEAVIDVRRFPGSRRFPHFGSEILSRALDEHAIAYCSLRSLGGRRRGGPIAGNVAWRHPAFRAYAEHMESEEFALGLEELISIAAGLHTAMMCAELLWWRCHRRLIADVLTSLGEQVVHIRDVGTTEVHRIRPPARIVNGVLTYERSGNDHESGNRSVGSSNAAAARQ
jgi:uncharacterized protein (DUF488 family)